MTDSIRWHKPEFFLAICLASALSGCVPGEDAADRAWPDGVIVLDSVPVLEFAYGPRVGSVDDPDRGFSQSGGVVAALDGDLFVFELTTMNIRRHDATGEFFNTVGRSGGGPGEFLRDNALMGVEGDRVWTWQRLPRRLTVFSRAGDLLQSTTIPDIGLEAREVGLARDRDLGAVPGRVEVIGVDADGLIHGSWVEEGSVLQNALARSEHTFVRAPRLRFGSLGEVVDTVGWDVHALASVTRPETVRVGELEFLPRNPEPDSPVTLADVEGQWVITRPRPTGRADALFQVSRLNLDGQVVLERTFGYEPIPYHDADLALQAGMAATGAGGGTMYLRGAMHQLPLGGPRLTTPPQDRERFQERILAAKDFPPFDVPVYNARLGIDGSLWLEVPFPGHWPRQRWLVLDSAAFPVTWVEMDDMQALASVAADHYWLVERDDLGLNWFQRMDLAGGEALD